MQTACVVTGGARGIGRGIAELMVARGHHVVIGDVDGWAAATTAAEIGAVAGLAQDVRDPSSHRLVAEEAARHGALTTWFNNAGVGDDGTLASLSDSQVRSLVEVNLLGTTWGTRAALAAFGPAGGDVVNIASLAALGPVPGYSMYAATKAAVVSLSASVNAEAPRGVRVHALCPDGADTAMLAAQDPSGLGSQLVHSGGPILSVAEVAAAAVSLVGSGRVVRAVPGWRGGVVRASALAPGRDAARGRAVRRAGTPGDEAPLASRTRRTIVRSGACIVRTRALTSYTCSIERLIDTDSLSVAPTRHSLSRDDRLILPQEATMSTLSLAPAFVPAPAARRSTVRLTRRGRLVVFLTSLFLVLVVAFMLAGGAVGTDEAGQPAPTEIVQVAPGDTLWGIASEIATDGDVRSVMSEIERLNALESASLAAGQKLRVPVVSD